MTAKLLIVRTWVVFINYSAAYEMEYDLVPMEIDYSYSKCPAFSISMPLVC